jgi:hypothetical protein
MWQPRIDDRVRLTQDVPEQSLHRGDVGTVRSIWCQPTCFYEVEFQGADADAACQTRALVREGQFEADEEVVLA